MKIETFCSFEKQVCRIGRHTWSVARLIQLSKDIPVIEVPIDHLNVLDSYDELTLRAMVMHMRAVMEADLAYPIILDEDGCIMDGRRRIMKAMLYGMKTVKAVRFEENPEPDKIADEKEKV